MSQFTYLVMLSHSLDDIPLRLFADRDEAFEFAESIGWELPLTIQKILELPDCGTPCVIAVWAYRDGEPVSRVIVRDWEDDDEAEVDSPKPDVPVAV